MFCGGAHGEMPVKNGSIPLRNKEEEATWSVTDRGRGTDRQSQLLTIRDS